MTGPPGRAVIPVSGGVLSTITVRAAEAVFWPWSVAAAVRVWTPSGLPLVSQLALAVMAGAGGAGSRGAAPAPPAPPTIHPPPLPPPPSPPPPPPTPPPTTP